MTSGKFRSTCTTAGPALLAAPPSGTAEDLHGAASQSSAAPQYPAHSPGHGPAQQSHHRNSHRNYQWSHSEVPVPGIVTHHQRERPPEPPGHPKACGGVAMREGGPVADLQNGAAGPALRAGGVQGVQAPRLLEGPAGLREIHPLVFEVGVVFLVVTAQPDQQLHQLFWGPNLGVVDQGLRRGREVRDVRGPVVHGKAARTVGIPDLLCDVVRLVGILHGDAKLEPAECVHLRGPGVVRNAVGRQRISVAPARPKAAHGQRVRASSGPQLDHSLQDLPPTIRPSTVGHEEGNLIQLLCGGHSDGLRQQLNGVEPVRARHLIVQPVR
eukprot:RCo029760